MSCYWIPCSQNGVNQCVQALDSDGYRSKKDCEKSPNFSYPPCQSSTSEFCVPSCRGYQQCGGGGSLESYYPTACCHPGGYTSLHNTWNGKIFYRAA